MGGWQVATAPRAPAWDLKIHNHAYPTSLQRSGAMYGYFQMRRLLQKH